MGWDFWPIAVVLWAVGALLVWWTRTGISRDNRVSIAIAVLFGLLGIAVLANLPVLVAFLICIPLGAGMIWAGVMPILDAVTFDQKITGRYQGSIPEIEGRKSNNRHLLRFSYDANGIYLTGTSVDTFAQETIDRDYVVGNTYDIWLSKKDPKECKVHRYENFVLVPFAFIVGAVFLAVPFIRLAHLL